MLSNNNVPGSMMTDEHEFRTTNRKISEVSCDGVLTWTSNVGLGWIREVGYTDERWGQDGKERHVKMLRQ